MGACERTVDLANGRTGNSVSSTVMPILLGQCPALRSEKCPALGAIFRLDDIKRGGLVVIDRQDHPACALVYIGDQATSRRRSKRMDSATLESSRIALTICIASGIMPDLGKASSSAQREDSTTAPTLALADFKA